MRQSSRCLSARDGTAANIAAATSHFTAFFTRALLESNLYYQAALQEVGVTFLAIVLSLALVAGGQQEPAGRGRGRGSPPQPQQKQGVEYFAGSWSFTWTGRESPVTAGPRKGTTVFTPAGSSLDIRTEGTVEDPN